ncbi:MAG: DNA cytosine methyltransferase [Prevotella sp.]|nr:DNA cytosine methyltransferase [Prevotella sp.]
MYRTIDLFAGAGGLSLGFLQTGKFDIKVAFENNPNMQETYRRNHPGVDVRGDVCAADYEEIQKQYGKIDVVIGGPPCQGFSNANRQKNHAISQNNMLVKQYIRAIRELQPLAFVMENVSMLRSDVHRFYLDKTDHDLIIQNSYDIPMQETKLVLLEKEYLFNGAMEIVQSLDAISENIWPEDCYVALNVIYKATKNPKKVVNALSKHKKKLLKYADKVTSNISESYIAIQSRTAFNAIQQFFDGTLEVCKLKQAIEPAIMIQRMLSKAKEIFDNQIVVDSYSDENDLVAVIRSYAVFDYLKAILGTEPNSYAINADILCAANYGAPQKRNRFIVMGIKKSLADEVKLPVGTFSEETYRTVRDAISDLQEVKTVTEVADDTGTSIKAMSNISELGRALRDTDTLFNHIITNTRETAMERFKALKQGQNFHSLDDDLKTNTYTDVSRTQNTIYLRLDYDQPSGTVVNVRKSMWVHPVLDRAVSVREAARLQTFPDSFVFCGTKDKQYQQVGNAVPPIMAKAIAKKLAKQLKKIEEKPEHR